MAYFIQSLCPVLNHFQKENVPVGISSINSNINPFLSQSQVTKQINPPQGIKRILSVPFLESSICDLGLQNHGLFNGMQIAIHIPPTEQSKLKSSLRKNVIDNGGQVSYTITRDTSLMVCGSSEVSALKLSAANRFNIPIVTSNYIDECVKQGKVLETEKFSLLNKLQSEAFRKGKINTTKPLSSISICNPKVPVQIEPVPYQGLEKYDLIKAVLLHSSKKISQSYNKSVESNCVRFLTLELHVLKEGYNEDASSKYCVFTHEGEVPILESKIMDDFGKKMCRFNNSVEQVRSVFCSIYYQMSGPPSFMKVSQEFLHQGIGSLAFQANQKDFWSASSILDMEIKVLVINIWNEAKLHISQFLENSETFLPEWKVKEAEGLLIQIVVALSKNKLALVNKLSKEFYSTITFKADQSLPLTNASDILRKLELCKILMNLSQIYEFSNFSTKGTVLSKYKALKCQIATVDPETEDFREVSNLILSSQTCDTGMVIHKVFSVKRNLESNTLDQDILNCKHLFHGTASSNLLGILMQGLSPSLSTLLNFYELENTEECMLGFGIYFSDSVNACLRFSKPGSSGTTFLLICKVGLGKIFNTYEPCPARVSAPTGYDSVLGVKSQEGQVTCFQENEYIIYKENQLELCYLVEYYLPHQNMKLTPIMPVDKEFEEIESSKTFLEIPPSKYKLDEHFSDIKEDILNSSLKEVRSLDTEKIKQVPLKSTHIRAYIVDLIARVTVFQVYKSGVDATRELQYSFPLYGGAAVCGFEAFIGNKHLIGEVKEKKIAHAEFKEAVSQGHGAYILDEEKPDVFTARIGNLLPNTTVIIKITYITELSVDSDTLKINFPSSLSPVQHDGFDLVNPIVTFEAGLQMATNILKILSPTHVIKVKNTDTKAVVNLREYSHFKIGLTLLIRMSDIHLPRMWIEEHPEKKSEVCMMSYYPEFEVSKSEKNTEIVLLIDASNSMSGPSFQTSLTVALLCLKNFSRNIFFNIVAFGISFKELFPESQQFTAKSKSQAIEFLRNLFPDMGGSNLMQPLRSCNVFTKLGNANIFLISDGYLESGCMLCQKIAKLQQIRLFTFAVSENSNKHFLKLSSNCSGGAYEEFIESEKTKWCAKVQDQIFRASQPSLSDVNIEWQQFDTNGEASVVVAPKKIKSLFSGSFLIAYGFVSNCTVATLKAKINDEEYTTVVSSHKLNQTSGTLIHSLAARAFIRDWEDGILEDRAILHVAQKENRKEDIITMAIDHNLVTSLTSFIAVEKRQDGEKITEEPSVDLLLLDCNVDILNYMSFEEILPMSIEVDSNEPSNEIFENCALSIPMSYQQNKRKKRGSVRKSTTRMLLPSPSPPGAALQTFGANLIPQKQQPNRKFGKSSASPRLNVTGHLQHIPLTCPSKPSETLSSVQYSSDLIVYPSLSVDNFPPLPISNDGDFNLVGGNISSLQSNVSESKCEAVNLIKTKKKGRSFTNNEGNSSGNLEPHHLSGPSLLSHCTALPVLTPLSGQGVACQTFGVPPPPPPPPLTPPSRSVLFSNSTNFGGSTVMNKSAFPSFSTQGAPTTLPPPSLPKQISNSTVFGGSSGFGSDFSPSGAGCQNFFGNFTPQQQQHQQKFLFGKSAGVISPPRLNVTEQQEQQLQQLPFTEKSGERIKTKHFSFAPKSMIMEQSSDGCSSSQMFSNVLTPPFVTSSPAPAVQALGASYFSKQERKNLPYSSATTSQTGFQSSQFIGGHLNFVTNFAQLQSTRGFSFSRGILPLSNSESQNTFAADTPDYLCESLITNTVESNAFASSQSVPVHEEEPDLEVCSEAFSSADICDGAVLRCKRSDVNLGSMSFDTNDRISENVLDENQSLFQEYSVNRALEDLDDYMDCLLCCNSAEADIPKQPLFFVSLIHNKQITKMETNKICIVEKISTCLGGGFPLCSMIYKSLSSLPRFKEEVCEIVKFKEGEAQSYVNYYWTLIFAEAAEESKNVFVQQGVLSMETLRKSGIKSMGPVINSCIFDLLKTISYVYSYLISYLVPYSMEEEHWKASFGDTQITTGIKKLAEKLVESLITDLKKDDADPTVLKSLDAKYIIVCLKRLIEIDQKYPLMYSTLNLGTSWENMIFSHLMKVSK